jgi:hypothetical protein
MDTIFYLEVLALSKGLAICLLVVNLWHIGIWEE